jgi:4-hydroxy-4-methyl-2-oxoglutarate aldolase
MMHKALLLAEEGDVLVVDGGDASGAQWGHLAALYAKMKGLDGVVVDGCIRDADDLVEQRSPVWFREISPAHPDKKGRGAVNVPVQCGNVLVHPGDLVCADGDGVLVVPRENVEAALFAAENRAVQEAEAVKAIEAGKSLFEIHNLSGAFEATGLKVIDGIWTKEHSKN